MVSVSWWPEWFTIADDRGTLRFEVQNIPGYAERLPVRAVGGDELAAIIRDEREANIQNLHLRNIFKLIPGAFGWRH